MAAMLPAMDAYPEGIDPAERILRETEDLLGLDGRERAERVVRRLFVLFML
jgi:hypothetical protein